MHDLMSTALEAFRHNVTRILDERELTMTQMAHDLNMSRPGLSRVLRGHDGVTLDRAEKIANYLNVPLTQLIHAMPAKQVARSA